MNILKPALLIVLLTAGASAQVASSSSGPTDVTVIKISWRSIERNPKLDVVPPIGNPEAAGRMAVNQARINEANDARTNSPTPTPPVLFEVPRSPDSPPTVRRPGDFVYEFTVKNTGSKIIRRLVWEYSFTDPSTQKVVGRREYSKSKKIRPGATAKLTVHSSSAPIGVISAAKAGQDWHEQSPEQMVIQRVEYTDGSVWVRN